MQGPELKKNTQTNDKMLKRDHGTDTVVDVVCTWGGARAYSATPRGATLSFTVSRCHCSRSPAVGAAQGARVKTACRGRDGRQFYIID